MEYYPAAFYIEITLPKNLHYMIYENFSYCVMGNISSSHLEIDRAIKKVLPFLADKTTYSQENIGNGKFRIGIGVEVGEKVARLLKDGQER